MMQTANPITRANGFTLIELLIVIGIIGILMAIIVPTYKSSVRKANEASAVTTLNAIKVAQAKYVIDHKEQYGTFKKRGGCSASIRLLSNQKAVAFILERHNRHRDRLGKSSEAAYATVS